MISKFLHESKWTIFVGLLIFTVAFLLRAFDLTSMPIFADEAIYIRWSQVMRAEPTLRFLPLSDGKQPFYMWSVMPMFKIFENPLIAGRMVSVLAGLGTLCGVFVLSHLMFKSKKVALISSLIYAISPYSVFFDRMALADTMLSMFGVWTLTFAVLTARTKRLDFAMITGFVLGGALLTKSPGFFFLLLMPVTIFISDFDIHDKKRSIVLLKLAGLWGVSALIGFGFFNILRLGPNFHMITTRNQDYLYPITHIFDRPLDPLKPFLDRIFEYYWFFGPWIVILFSIFAVVDNYKKYWRELVVLLVWILLPILYAAEFSQTMTARYVYFTFPYVVILAGLAFIPYVEGKNQKSILKMLYFFLGLFVFLSLRLDYYLIKDIESANLPRSERSGYLEEWTSGSGIYEASELIKNDQVNNPDRKIVVGTEGYFGTLPDGLQMYMNDMQEVTVVGVGLNFIDIPLPLQESRDFGNTTYFLVNSSRLKISPDDLGLVKVMEWPKAQRPVGSWEYNQNGPQEFLYLFKVESLENKN